MILNWDPILIVNIILCVIILILGLSRFKKTGIKMATYIAFAFAIFGVSHICGFLGLKKALEYYLVAIRFIAYLLVIIGLIKISKKINSSKER